MEEAAKNGVREGGFSQLLMPVGQRRTSTGLPEVCVASAS